VPTRSDISYLATRKLGGEEDSKMPALMHP
jgi:hypothetical protein